VFLSQPERTFVSESAQVIKIDPVSVVGLDDVFDLEPVPEGSAAPVTGYPEHVTDAIEQVPTNANGVPVEQAAAILGTSGNVWFHWHHPRFDAGL
jgi:hypothetical protein